MVGGLVAQQKRELPFLGASGKIAGQSPGLEPHGALGEPVVLRHLLDEHGFGDGGGLMLGVKSDEEEIEFLLLFGGEDGECAAESPTEIVERGDGFARLGARAGTVL